jgi:hypothetical protein
MFRLHDQSKTVSEARAWLPEEQRVTETYLPETRFAERRDVLPALHLRFATRMITASSYDRRIAIRYAWAALRSHGRLVFSSAFVSFVSRLVVPHGVLITAARAQRWVRAPKRIAEAAVSDLNRSTSDDGGLDR